MADEIDAQKKVEQTWWETTEIREQENQDKLPALKKAIKEKYGNDKKLIHNIPIKFLNKGKEIEVDDRFNQNEGQPIKKIVLEVEWDKQPYVFFVNKSHTDQSLCGQLVRFAEKHKGLVDNSCILTITGKLGDKSMRYIIEDGEGETPSSIKEFSEVEYKILREIGILAKKHKEGAHESEICEAVGIKPKHIDEFLLNLKGKGAIEHRVVEGLEYWKCIK